MVVWKFMLRVILIAVAFVLITINFTYYAGDLFFQQDSAGFLSGAVHGILAPITLVMTLFNGIGIYEVNNSGWFYSFGFILGILLVWGGGVGGSSKHVIKNYYSPPKAEKSVKHEPQKIIKHEPVKKKKFFGGFTKNKPLKKISKMKEEKVTTPIKVSKNKPLKKKSKK